MGRKREVGCQTSLAPGCQCPIPPEPAARRAPSRPCPVTHLKTAGNTLSASFDKLLGLHHGRSHEPEEAARQARYLPGTCPERHQTREGGYWRWDRPFAEGRPETESPPRGEVNAGYLGDIPEAHVKMPPGLQMAGRCEKGGDWGCGFLFLAVLSIITTIPFPNVCINSVLVTRISCSCPQCILPTSYGENAQCKASGYLNSTASSLRRLHPPFPLKATTSSFCSSQSRPPPAPSRSLASRTGS
jgi:hypothetical protein